MFPIAEVLELTPLVKVVTELFRSTPSEIMPSVIRGRLTLNPELFMKVFFLSLLKFKRGMSFEY